MGFALIQYACVFVFISSSVGVEMEANCVCCLCLALQPSEKWALSSPWSLSLETTVMWLQHRSV